MFSRLRISFTSSWRTSGGVPDGSCLFRWYHRPHFIVLRHGFSTDHCSACGALLCSLSRNLACVGAGFRPEVWFRPIWRFTKPVRCGCMRGTDYANPRCIALTGVKVGGRARCGIYADRPSPCREFAPLAEVGIFSEACNRARSRHGLPPLRVGD